MKWNQLTEEDVGFFLFFDYKNFVFISQKERFEYEEAVTI